MSKFESAIKQVPYPQQNVYQMLSDLSNIERVKDRLPEDKFRDLSFDRDTVSLAMPPVGQITLNIIDREEPKCVKFESVDSPMPFHLWIQVLPVTAESSKMKVTVDADIPFMLKGMVSGPLQDGVEKIADALAMIPY
jgi:carbon monoxide dehydrogenase subunit G